LLPGPLIVNFVLCNCKSIGYLMVYGMFYRYLLLLCQTYIAQS